MTTSARKPTSEFSLEWKVQVSGIKCIRPLPGLSAKLSYIEHHWEQILNRQHLITVFLACLISTIGQAAFAGQTESQDAFFQQISSLCGARFVGHSVFPEDPGDAWRDQILVAQIESCTADEVTLYGGTTQSAGTHLSQSFPADAYTADLIPEASTNEWFISFNKDSSELTYYNEHFEF